MNKLNDEQRAEILMGDVSDIEDFHDEDEINTVNLDELLLTFEDDFNVVIIRK